MHLAQGRLSRRLRTLATTLVVSVAGLTFVASANAEGSNFVIGDHNSAVGTSVTFWGAQWWKLNSLSGGTAPAAFKGFANNVSGPGCGATWTTDPGNSSDPPLAPLPAVIEVIVASHITKSGRIISGDVSEVVLVATNLGYANNPGHAGTGTVLGVLCSRAAEERAHEEKLKEEEKAREEAKRKEEETKTERRTGRQRKSRKRTERTGRKRKRRRRLHVGLSS